MPKTNVVQMNSREIGRKYCGCCKRLIQIAGLPVRKSDVDVYHLPPELLEKVNQMDADRKFDLFYNCTIEKWRELLEEFGVDFCRCGAIR